MEERRQHSRFATELQLEVLDLHSGQRLGRIVDLSMDGFMLLSELPLAADSVWECRLVPLTWVEGLEEIRLGADCLWTRMAEDQRNCWAGFHIIDLADDQATVLEDLLQSIRTP
ncbi:PilZ domain-containing protein [Pseudomonas resinovorans]|uniref:PilZ domain-containing protein n=1 Tax=Metapseudomonas resinovorans TaxID=53412 RepID=A0ABT4Y056_METRE|nr:PilZ domain-containing protein [Pseudomonas resinovorans]MDA8482050.1 PilZ domain-containing protein [Pseudomonas resinovorans]